MQWCTQEECQSECIHRRKLKEHEGDLAHMHHGKLGVHGVCMQEGQLRLTMCAMMLRA
jgi:hypothetical protein